MGHESWLIIRMGIEVSSYKKIMNSISISRTSGLLTLRAGNSFHYQIIFLKMTKFWFELGLENFRRKIAYRKELLALNQDGVMILDARVLDDGVICKHWNAQK